MRSWCALICTRMGRAMQFVQLAALTREETRVCICLDRTTRSGSGCEPGSVRCSSSQSNIMFYSFSVLLSDTVVAKID